MRDPDLVVRAERAAAALERAWDRWRTLHGMGAEPPPPVSSYVGYSLEEPMGQPRVVFGVAAEEAELLASLLNRHECAGPAAARQEAAEAGSPLSRPAAGTRQQVPAQGPAGPPERLRPAWPAPDDGRPADLPRANGTARYGTLGNWTDGANGHGTGGRMNGTSGHGTGSQANLIGPLERPARPVQVVPPLRPAPLSPATLPVQAEHSRPGWAATPGYAPAPARAEAASASVAAPGMAHEGGQSGQPTDPADGSGVALLALRSGTKPVPFPGPGAEPAPFAEAGQAGSGQVAERPRGHRRTGEHALPHSGRQRRASAVAERDAVPPVKPAAAPQGAGRGRDGREHQGLSTMAGDLAGWASGELPGQARRQPGAG
jgi:hypothetical protein